MIKALCAVSVFGFQMVEESRGSFSRANLSSFSGLSVILKWWSLRKKAFKLVQAIPGAST